jgi:hypothetical protein
MQSTNNWLEAMPDGSPIRRPMTGIAKYNNFCENVPDPGFPDMLGVLARAEAARIEEATGQRALTISFAAIP